MDEKFKLDKITPKTREEKLKRLNFLYESIEENYDLYLHMIMKSIPNAYNHNDILQQAILNIIERLKKCIDGDSDSIIFSEEVFDVDIKNFCDRFMNKSIKRESLFIFINSSKKNNLKNRKESMVKSSWYEEGECLNFEKFKENMELQDFYDILPSEEIALIRLLIEGHSIQDICGKLKICRRKYYDIVNDLKAKIIASDIIDQDKVRTYNKQKEKK